MHPLPCAVTFFTSVPVITAIFALRNERSSSLEISSSSSGARFGAYSTTVTWVPNVLKNVANSAPIAPEPITTIEAGSSFKVRACREVMIRSPSTGINGNSLGRAPVAKTICRASYRVVTPSEAATSTVCGTSVSAPVPTITSTLFFFSRKSIPLLCSATVRLRSTIFGKSGFSAPSAMPTP